MNRPQNQADTLASGLEGFLSASYGEQVLVSGVRRLTGGTSHETWAFDASFVSRAQDRLEFVLRRDFSKDVLDLDLKTEFALLTALYQAGIPVPQACFCVADNSPIGTPFIISERLNGTDIRKVMAQYSGAVSSLGKTLTSIQASIHQLDWLPVVVNTKLAVNGSPIKYQVEKWCESVKENIVAPEPLLGFAVNWLRTNLPIDAPIALIHGDFKANNLLIDSDNRVAVIDWELAHIGDPYEDLAFTLLWTTPHDIVGGMLSRNDYLACYEKSSGQSIDQERLCYWQIFALVKLAAIFLKGFNEKNSNEIERPTRIMLLRAMPWINAQLGELLSEHYKGINR